MGLIIACMQPQDWPAVHRIYQEGIDAGQATFETSVPSWEEWDASKARACRLVAKEDGTIVGWATLSPVSTRKVYAGVAEVSIYVAKHFQGAGIGTRLLRELITCSEEAGFWTLQAVMFPENEASVTLHRKCGFRLVGTREKIAAQHGIWRDTILMERRSTDVS